MKVYMHQLGCLIHRLLTGETLHLQSQETYKGFYLEVWQEENKQIDSSSWRFIKTEGIASLIDKMLNFDGMDKFSQLLSETKDILLLEQESMSLSQFQFLALEQMNRAENERENQGEQIEKLGQNFYDQLQEIQSFQVNKLEQNIQNETIVDFCSKLLFENYIPTNPAIFEWFSNLMKSNFNKPIYLPIRISREDKVDEFLFSIYFDLSRIFKKESEIPQSDQKEFENPRLAPFNLNERRSLIENIIFISKQQNEESTKKEFKRISHLMTFLSINKSAAGQNLNKPINVKQEVQGVQLEKFINKMKPNIPENQLNLSKLDIVENIALGLQELHSKGMVHGELNPMNVLIAQDSVKLSMESLVSCSSEDLRIVRQINKDPTIAIEECKELYKTSFKSPRQLKAEESSILETREVAMKQDQMYDIWAFGCITNFVFTGKKFFQSDHRQSRQIIKSFKLSYLSTYQKCMQYMQLKSLNNPNFISDKTWDRRCRVMKGIPNQSVARLIDSMTQEQTTISIEQIIQNIQQIRKEMSSSEVSIDSKNYSKESNKHSFKNEQIPSDRVRII